MNALTNLARRALAAGLDLLDPKGRRSVKERFELRYWQKLHRGIAALPRDQQGPTLRREREHYERFYTTFFRRQASDYAGKRILDVGCGPMGSLEWAEQAALRVGVDPLAARYQNLRAERHAMLYVAAASESLPFATASFDVVTSFNMLDHVADVAATVAELKRVADAGGAILLITEIDHQPRLTQPNRLQRSVIELFAPECDVVSERLSGVRPDHDVYASLSEGTPYREGEPGMLCAEMRKRP